MPRCKEKYGGYSENNSRLRSLSHRTDDIFDGL
jgi:hypothetical protein